MKQVLILVTLLLVSCSPESSEFKNNKVITNTGNDKIMQSNITLTPRVWQGFDVLYKSIQSEQSEDRLENYAEKIFDWKSNSSVKELAEKDNKIISGLYLILKDEIKRHQELLSNSIGRQPATDWIASLISHLNRMSIELEIVETILPHRQDLESSLKILSNSLKFSVELLEEDIDQIIKREAAGNFLLTSEQQSLIKTAQQKTEQAKIINSKIL
jgi:hypothetical protein